MERKVSRRRALSATSGALALLAGCSGGTETESEDGNAGSGDQTTDTGTQTGDGETETTGSDGGQQSKSATVPVGEVVADDSVAMVVRGTERTDKLGEFQEADSGNTFVVVRLAVKNTSDGFVNFSSFFQTRIKDEANTVYDATFGATDHPIQSGILASGEVARGDVVFELPKDAGGLTLQFDFSAMDFFEFERVAVTLGKQASEIADLSQSLNVDVRSPGAKATHEDVGVTVHGVRTTTKLGEFTQAAEGREYVVPDVEIHNGTGEELSVSTLLQMRVKTGSGLSYTPDIGGSSQLDRGYSEGSPIAAGEARRGELAYEVSTEAKPLYWTFDFLDIGEGNKAFWKLR